MLQAVRDVYEETRDALKALGLSMSARVSEDNLTGDEGMDGYVLVENAIAIYPQEVDGILKCVGWGVSAETITPGCHTMPNGDPGYPDEPDVLEIAAPFVESRSLTGSIRLPRTPRQAVCLAVMAIVESRLGDWLYHGGPDEDQS